MNTAQKWILVLAPSAAGTLLHVLACDWHFSASRDLLPSDFFLLGTPLGSLSLTTAQGWSLPLSALFGVILPLLAFVLSLFLFCGWHAELRAPLGAPSIPILIASVVFIGIVPVLFLAFGKPVPAAIIALLGAVAIYRCSRPRRARDRAPSPKSTREIQNGSS